MGSVEDYRENLRRLDSWEAFLMDQSRLPGPRANLELAFAVAIEGSRDQIICFATLPPEESPKNTKEEFLAICGVIGLGYLAARGEGRYFSILREKASDPRWRIRESVALGLQKFGQTSFEDLVEIMIDWSKGSLLEKRAVVATLCEPCLLLNREDAIKTFDILDQITFSILAEEDRRGEDFKVLRKALGYGWSVAVAAQPDIGKTKMEKWVKSSDPDILWIMRQNLKKNRLLKMDSTWVKTQVSLLDK